MDFPQQDGVESPFSFGYRKFPVVFFGGLVEKLYLCRRMVMCW